MASGVDRIQHEDWFLVTFGPTGLLDNLASDGTYMAQASACVVDAAHARCHETAIRYWTARTNDWWLGLAFGLIDGEWNWFFHSWLTPIDLIDHRIEASTSFPKAYFGVRIRSVSPDLRGPLSQDPPTV